MTGVWGVTGYDADTHLVFEHKWANGRSVLRAVVCDLENRKVA